MACHTHIQNAQSEVWISAGISLNVKSGHRHRATVKRRHPVPAVAYVTSSITGQRNYQFRSSMSMPVSPPINKRNQFDTSFFHTVYNLPPLYRHESSPTLHTAVCMKHSDRDAVRVSPALLIRLSPSSYYDH